METSADQMLIKHMDSKDQDSLNLLGEIIEETFAIYTIINNKIIKRYVRGFFFPEQSNSIHFQSRPEKICGHLMICPPSQTDYLAKYHR